jgi:hypothetical protein
MITPGLREKILVDFPNDPYHYHYGVSNHGLQVRIKILPPATEK